MSWKLALWPTEFMPSTTNLHYIEQFSTGADTSAYNVTNTFDFEFDNAYADHNVYTDHNTTIK